MLYLASLQHLLKRFNRILRQLQCLFRNCQDVVIVDGVERCFALDLTSFFKVDAIDSHLQPDVILLMIFEHLHWWVFFCIFEKISGIISQIQPSMFRFPYLKSYNLVFVVLIVLLQTVEERTLLKVRQIDVALTQLRYCWWFLNLLELFEIDPLLPEWKIEDIVVQIPWYLKITRLPGVHLPIWLVGYDPINWALMFAVVREGAGLGAFGRLLEGNDVVGVGL